MFLDLSHEEGPFAIIGDIHGCFEELSTLLYQLDGRNVIFVGDLGDRGPYSTEVFSLVMEMCANYDALCVIGNHDDKLRRWLRGNPVHVSKAMSITIEGLMTQSEKFRDNISDFLESLPHHIILDGGKLVVTHAGMREDLLRVDSSESRSFSLYGDVSEERDEDGFLIRRNWAEKYEGDFAIVYGHQVVDESVWVNNTIDIDNGCVFGGKLTALLYPERELISVDSKETYFNK